MKTARQIRAEIGPVDFQYHIRIWRDGERWAVTGLSFDRLALIERLEELGYAPRMDGIPGTAGQDIIRF
jgi:hypothetical protein